MTIGSAVLQTQLTKRLPAQFLDSIPGGVSITYALIPIISQLEEPTKSEVQDAFAESLVVLWEVMIGISALSLLTSLFMKSLPLHTETDKQWSMKEGSNHDAHDVTVEAHSLAMEST